MIKTLWISAGLAALAAVPCHAQLLGVQGGLSGSVNAPLSSSIAGAELGASGQVNGSASVAPATPPLPAVKGAISDTAQGAVNDSRTLNPGTASANASARVSADDAAASAGVGAGMIIRDMGGMTLGRVVSATKNTAGQVASFVIETADGVRRAMPAGGLTLKGGAAVTTQSEADLVALPQVR